jgi:hypothetical protein
MKRIVLTADEDLIKLARKVARAQHTSLSAAFREWPLQFTAGAADAQRFDELMKRLQYVNSGRHFGRDEMNTR